MNPILSIIILLEVLFTLFIAWGLMHEEKFIAFEDKFFLWIRRKLHRK